MSGLAASSKLPVSHEEFPCPTFIHFLPADSRQRFSVATWPAQIDKAVCSASAWLPISPHVSPCSFGCSQGVNTDSGGNSTSGAGGGGVRSAQEAKNSTRSTAAGALVIFNGILIFPLVFFALLAQLLFSLLLFCH